MNNIEEKVKNIKFYDKVYEFTNENVLCLKKLYNFENSKVLTVIGSGDQYFVSVLNGAKDVDIFDINFTTYLYFVLKFYVIKTLSYEEFYKLLINKEIDNYDIYLKLSKVLPNYCLNYYNYLVYEKQKNYKMDNCFKTEVNFFKEDSINKYFNISESLIPYFNKEEYYKLQEILQTRELPNFYNCDLLNLKDNINKKYDIMLLSNIYDYLKVNVSDYKKYLNGFDIPQIQARYSWLNLGIDEFLVEGFILDEIESAGLINSEKNYVLSLKNNKL